MRTALVMLGSFGLALAPACAQTAQQHAQDINISFNGPYTQFPYTDQFFTATNTYYQSIGRVSMPGNRHCHAYLSWDIAEQTVGSGPVGKEGSRAWFEAWLTHAQGHCDRALLTFKFIDSVTQISPNGYPEVSTYETGMVAFLGTDWSYTGWTGQFDYTAWNEPNNPTPSGDGLTVQIPAERAADYYLALRKHCAPSTCGGDIAAGDFGSNGDMWEDFVQNCSNDLATTLCSNASYMDKYKHWLSFDAPTYGFTTDFRPEVFGYHGWDDVNNYINQSSHCTDVQRCTLRALVNALSNATWTSSSLWDTEVGAGQYPNADPNAVTQACAASFLLNLTASVTTRVARIYYTKAFMNTGDYWSLFDSNANIKPAFTVLADRNISYSPPAGSSCP
jgi:hypothetical protein